MTHQDNTLSRRALLKGGAAGGLLLAAGLTGVTALAQAPAGAGALGLFLRVDANGAVTVLAPCMEMGQGSYTALAMIVADELAADWSAVSVVPAPLGAGYRLPGVPIQHTSGSQMVRSWNAPLRRSAAAAREMLTLAAARQWSVEPASCSVEGGKVVHAASGRSLGFGELVAEAARLPVPPQPALIGKRSVVGRQVQRLDIPAKVDGSAQFGVDVRLPGMVYAAIRQAPVYGTKLVSVDAKTVEGRPGVIDVVKLPDGVAVVADRFWRAKAAVEALQPRFTTTQQSKLSTREIARAQGLLLDSPVARTAVHTGDVLEGMARARSPVTSDFFVPYLHHATMEPMTCTVQLSADKLEFWVPTQNITGVADMGARLTGLPLDKIVVNATFLGGGFGRKFEQDFVEQAVLIAKAVKRPVQLIWSREEDVQHGRYRPMMSARLAAVLKDDGDIDAMTIRLVGPSINEFRGAGIPFTTEYDFRATLGISTESPSAPARLQQYAVKNFLTDIIYAPSHVPVGSWRSVGASENGFFIESFMDELAIRAKKDPYRFRRHLLRESPRALAVLDKVAAEAGWGKPLPKGHALGIAFSECVGSMVAQVAQVSLVKGAVKVHRVVCAIDCGTAVSPDNVKAQVEGGIVMGLSAALGEEITIAEGRCVQSNFHDYPILRLADAPRIEVHIIDSGAALGGVGEAGLPALAPAVCNALHALTGKRIRSLPIKHHRLTA